MKKSLLFLLPLLVLTGCNNIKTEESKTNEIKIGFYDDLKLCTNEKCEGRHRDYISYNYVGKVVYNSVSLIEDSEKFTIRYDVMKIDRDEQTGFLYYSEASTQEKEDLYKTEPTARIEEETFSKAGNYYQYIKKKEYSVPLPVDPEAEYKEKYWEYTENAFNLALTAYDTYYYTSVNVSYVTRITEMYRLYQEIINAYETLQSGRYNPQPKSGWDRHTPEEYKNVLLSFYEFYTIPFVRTAAEVNVIDGYEGYNSGWTIDSTQFTSALENYQIVFNDVRSIRLEARASCELEEDTRIVIDNATFEIVESTKIKFIFEKNANAKYYSAYFTGEVYAQLTPIEPNTNYEIPDSLVKGKYNLFMKAIANTDFIDSNLYLLGTITKKADGTFATGSPD